jgi:hypothetical protein
MRTIKDSVDRSNDGSHCPNHPDGVDPGVVIADETFGESSEESEVKKPDPKK